jgi:hypothetical protein
MRLSFLPLLTFIAACAPNVDWEPAEPGDIFRYTAVGNSYPLDSIVLGESWGSAAKYGAQAGDTLTALPSGTFAGADAIAVHRDSAGIVTSIEFAYHRRQDVAALVNDYRTSLGEPDSVSTDTVGGSTRIMHLWRNTMTEFLMMTVAPPLQDGVAALAILSDRSRVR